MIFPIGNRRRRFSYYGSPEKKNNSFTSTMGVILFFSIPAILVALIVHCK